MKVLYLTPWYPSARDKMEGLFVQKHVEAVRAQGVDVQVIYSQRWREMWQQWRKLKRTWGVPDVVQLNIIQKQGLLALWLKRRYGVPYVIVEHWRGYLPENNAVRKNGLHTRLMQVVCRNAEVVMPVSLRLRQAMQDLGFEAKCWEKINNVVDDFFFQKVDSRKSIVDSGKRKVEGGRFTFLHISCFDERAKNVKGLLRAAKILSEKTDGWQMMIVGTGKDYKQVRAYADTLDLPYGLVSWLGELTPREVDEAFDQAEAFVLPSNYENAPVVISESIAKGVPIISTRAGGIPEMVNAENGVLVTPGKDNELAEAMAYMLNHHADFNRETIRQGGQQYSYAEVGKKLKQIYEQAIQKHQ